MSDPTTNLLDLDLGQVDTSYPVIKGGIYDMVVKNIEVVDNKSQDGKNLKIVLATTAPTTSVNNEKFEPGQLVTTQLSLKTKSEKRDEAGMKEIIVKRVATFLQATRPPVIGIKGSDLFDGSIATKCNVFVGRSVRIKLDALPEGRDMASGKTLPPRNEVTQFIKV